MCIIGNIIYEICSPQSMDIRQFVKAPDILQCLVLRHRSEVVDLRGGKELSLLQLLQGNILNRKENRACGHSVCVLGALFPSDWEVLLFTLKLGLVGYWHFPPGTEWTVNVTVWEPLQEVGARVWRVTLLAFVKLRFVQGKPMARDDDAVPLHTVAHSILMTPREIHRPQEEE